MTPSLELKRVCLTPFGHRLAAQPTLKLLAQTTCGQWKVQLGRADYLKSTKTSSWLLFFPSETSRKCLSNLIECILEEKYADLCVVATDISALFGVVIIMLFFIFPTFHCTRHFKNGWRVACPYVFSYWGEVRMHRAGVVFKQTVSCPLSGSNGQVLIPCLQERDRRVRHFFLLFHFLKVWFIPKNLPTFVLCLIREAKNRSWPAHSCSNTSCNCKEHWLSLSNISTCFLIRCYKA